MEALNNNSAMGHDELLREIRLARSVIYAPGPLHEDPTEDMAIRVIWRALLRPLLKQLDEANRTSGVT